jgi:TM2 domain-containing membrane protein YozV
MLDEINLFITEHQTPANGFPYSEKNNREDPGSESDTLSKNRMGAILLSLFIPGLGQSYNGKWIRGLLVLIATAAGLIIFILPGLVIWTYGIYDTGRTTREINEGRIPYTPVNGYIVLVHFLAGLALVVFSIILFVILYWDAAGVQMITGALGGPGY